MTLQVSQAHLDARLAGSLAHLDAGTGRARIRIYEGVQPDLGGTATNLLVEITLTKPAGVIASGVLSLTQSGSALIMRTGVATWARVINGNGEIAFDCDVTDDTGTGILKLSSTQLYAGGNVPLQSAVIG
ncbi:hypothetical protein ACO0LM_11805 [Undibacterium sp. Di26W]|uniref:hypothetical protein n=1 Tax=Undibacterium sp. Di26W TaxID=3413035 RepID=UPI003BF2EF66